jgi:Uncharacterized protein conserved in bacteria
VTGWSVNVDLRARMLGSFPRRDLQDTGPAMRQDETREFDVTNTATSVTAARLRNRNGGYDALRIISICGVVSIHTFGAMVAHDEIRWSVGWWLALVLSAGFVWAVPVFVMLSGALTLSPRAHRDGPGAFYARRVRRILPALIAWNVIYLVVIRMLVLGQQFSTHQLVTLIVDADVYPQLYFLWLILGLIVVAPVIAAFLHEGGPRRALIMAGVSLGFTLVVFMVPGVLGALGIPRPIYLGALTMWLPYVGYFVAGYALSTVIIPRGWVAAMAGATLLLAAGTTLQRAFADHLPWLQAISPAGYLGAGVACVAIGVFVVGTRLFSRAVVADRTKSILATLSDASFGVFLVHLVVLLVVYKSYPAFSSGTSFVASALSYVVVIVVSFAISIGAQRVPWLRAIF